MMMNTQKHISKKFRRGSILGAVIVIGLCLALLGFGMLQMGLGARLNSAISVSQISAREAADAGLTHVLYRMNAAVNFDGSINLTLFPPISGTVAMDSSNTTAVYQISEFPGVRYPYYVITSTGRVNNEERRIQTVHAITRRSTYWFGVGVQDTFFVHDNATFGTYPPGSVFEGSVRTNSTANDAITIMTDNPIPGDVAYGPGGNQDIVIKTPGDEPEEVINGSIYGADNTLAFPDAELPPDVVIASLGGWQTGPALSFVNTSLDELGNPILDEYGNPVTISVAQITNGAYVYNGDLNITAVNGTAWTEVQILGQVVINVIGDMRLGTNCRIVIGDHTPNPLLNDTLGLYLGRDDPSGPSGYSSLVTENGSAFMTMPRPPDDLPHSLDLQIYGLPSCTTVGDNPAITIHNSGEFWGVIYAPDARLNIHNSGIMYGSFIGYSLDLYSNGAFYYDSRIPLEYDEGPYFFEIERWWEDNQHLDLPTS